MEDIDRPIVSEIKFARTKYYFKNSLAVQFKVHDGKAEYGVNELQPCFVGYGETLIDAELNWRFKIHKSFQVLFRKRPFQMTSKELVEWSLLEKVIDTERFEKEWSVSHRELGYVLDNNSHNYSVLIQWLGGGQERIDLIHGEYPVELITYPQAQHFEAITRRVSSTGKLLEVLHVQTREPLKRMGEEEAKKFWEKNTPGIRP